MNLFQHSQGYIIAFGFDMVKRVPNPQMICWCDPTTKSWETSAGNLAGNYVTTFELDPEFIRECDGVIVAYQSGLCIEMHLIGAPYVWSYRPLFPAQSSARRAA